uniref:Uncharacterized protein n=1 Tax=Leersia perrieri TaxID=77586 RepID=A0A0D9VDZ9_9ORYZ
MVHYARGKGNNVFKVVRVKTEKCIKNNSRSSRRSSLEHMESGGLLESGDRCLDNINMVIHPMCCVGWTWVACICCVLMLFAFYLVNLQTQPPDLRSLHLDNNNLENLALSTTIPFAPSPVAVELFKLRKLMMMTLPPPPPSLTAGGHVARAAAAAAAAVGIVCLLLWLVSMWRRDVNALDFSEKTEENLVHNLVERNTVGRTAAGEPLYCVVIEQDGRNDRYRTVIVKKLEIDDHNDTRDHLEIRTRWG